MKQVLLVLALAFSSTLWAQDPVSFTLRNGSMSSIPLKIPGVMNPNLSPMSNSGVRLAVGQEIFFFDRKKKRLLLIVTGDLEGQTLLVNQLIKERIRELEQGRQTGKS